MRNAATSVLAAVALLLSSGCGSHSASSGSTTPLPQPTTSVGTPCAKQPQAAGWVKAENAKPGDTSWRDSFDPDSFPVTGYLGEVSAACGDTLDLHLSGLADSASVTAYRIGWYGGAGGRAVWHASDIPVVRRGIRRTGPPTYMAEASWPVSLRISVTTDWTPGFYLLIARAAPHDPGAAIPLVVRDDTDSSPLLFQASVLTYQAYNNYGRYSLYNGPKDLSDKRSDRSRVASFDRPYNGAGYQAPFLYDIPLAQQAEKLGLDVDYTTDIDVDRRPAQVKAHRALLVGGHSEYWTRRMYDAALAARDHGTNIAFFGANEIYWHARLEASPSGPERHMVVYRHADEDPLAQTDPAQATVQWDSSELQRPEAQLVGAAYGELGADGGSFRVLQPDSWVFAGTGVTKEQVLKDSLGGEYDTVKDDPATPPNIDVIAAVPILFAGHPTMATMSYYSAPSGAGVFAAGITHWDCQLVERCNNHKVDPGTSRLLAAMTDNVLTAFAAGPAGRAHPSQHRSAPAAEALISSAASQSDIGVGPPSRKG